MLKRFLRAILCGMLCATMLMTSTGVYATTIQTSNTNFTDQYVMKCLPDLLSMLLKDPGHYGLTSTELIESSVSNAFIISGGKDDATYYALMLGNKVLGIITVGYRNGGYTLTFAKDFADTLNKILSEAE